ncbi:MAG: hypothetical protein R3E32_00525 [Chitinophagales bacterium]
MFSQNPNGTAILKQTSNIQIYFLKITLFLLAITLQFKASLAQEINKPSTVGRQSSTLFNLRTKTLYFNKNQQSDTLQLDTLTIVPNSIKALYPSTKQRFLFEFNT